jgi:hypothetical protein
VYIQDWTAPNASGKSKSLMVMVWVWPSINGLLNGLSRIREWWHAMASCTKNDLLSFLGFSMLMVTKSSWG